MSKLTVKTKRAAHAIVKTQFRTGATDISFFNRGTNTFFANYVIKVDYSYTVIKHLSVIVALTFLIGVQRT